MSVIERCDNAGTACWFLYTFLFFWTFAFILVAGWASHSFVSCSYSTRAEFYRMNSFTNLLYPHHHIYRGYHAFVLMCLILNLVYRSTQNTFWIDLTMSVWQLFHVNLMHKVQAAILKIFYNEIRYKDLNFNKNWKYRKSVHSFTLALFNLLSGIEFLCP